VPRSEIVLSNFEEAYITSDDHHNPESQRTEKIDGKTFEMELAGQTGKTSTRKKLLRN
jgi:hypothetical protein